MALPFFGIGMKTDACLVIFKGFSNISNALLQMTYFHSADPFCGLVVNFYSLKTKKIPAGRVIGQDTIGWVFYLIQE